MIKKVYYALPTDLKGIEYNSYGKIVIIDKDAFIRSFAERERIKDLVFLLDDAGDIDEMMDTLEEALELRKKRRFYLEKRRLDIK